MTLFILTMNRTKQKLLHVIYTLNGGKWDIFDHQGNPVIAVQYNWIGHTFKDDLFVINPAGLMYYYQGEQEDGVWCAKDGLFGLINFQKRNHCKASL
jgi:hypothetical protein